MRDKEIITIIKTSKNIVEVLGAWSGMQKDTKQLFRVHPFVASTMIRIISGKDKRFTIREVREGMEKRYRARNSKRSNND